MKCPACGARMKTRDVRAYQRGRVVRRRTCACGHEMFTHEGEVKPHETKKVRYLLSVLRNGTQRTRRRDHGN